MRLSRHRDLDPAELAALADGSLDPQRRTAVAAAAVAVLEPGTSDERFHAALRPTALLPDAGGEATLTRTSSGWRIHLQASGLPRLDGGRFYEAWLRDAAGVSVPIGTFNEGTDVTLWAGVSPKTFKLLTITRENDDRKQASSGDHVLAGAVAPLSLIHI